MESATLPRHYLIFYAILAILPALVFLANPSAPPFFYPRGDLGTTLWNFWWFDQTVWHGKSPYYTGILFHPFGTSLFLHTFELFDAFITTPFRLIEGPVLAWKVAYVLHNLWTAVAVHLLARRLGTGNWGAALCAVLLMLSDYRIVGVAALSLMSTGHVFFLAWAVIGCWQKPERWLRGSWVGLAFLLLLFSHLYYLLFTSIFLGLTGFVLLIYNRPGKKELLGWSKQIALATIISIFPLLFLLRGMSAAEEHLGAISGYEEWYQVRGSAELLQFFLPRWLHLLLTGRQIPDHVWADMAIPMRAISFCPPLIVLGIAAAGFLLQHRDRKAGKSPAQFHSRTVRLGLLCVLVASLFVAMGPRIKLWTSIDPADVPAEETGRTVPHWKGISIPSPYKLVAQAPVLKQVRWNFRAGYFFQAALLLLIAPAFEKASRIVREKAGDQSVHWFGIAGLTIAICLLENPVPVYSTALIRTQKILELPDHQGTGGAVFSFPHATYVVQGTAMFDQTIHHRPIFGGYLSRGLPDYDRWLAGRPWIKLMMLAPSPGVAAPTKIERQKILESAAEDGLQYIIYYPSLVVQDEENDYVSNFLLRNDLFRIAAEDDIRIIFEVNKPENRED